MTPKSKPTRNLADVEERIQELVVKHWGIYEKANNKPFSINLELGEFINSVYWWFGFKDSTDVDSDETKYLDLDSFLMEAKRKAEAPYYAILGERRKQRKHAED